MAEHITKENHTLDDITEGSINKHFTSEEKQKLGQTEIFTTDEKNKLAGIEENAISYVDRIYVLNMLKLSGNTNQTTYQNLPVLNTGKNFFKNLFPPQGYKEEIIRVKGIVCAGCYVGASGITGSLQVLFKLPNVPERVSSEIAFNSTTETIYKIEYDFNSQDLELLNQNFDELSDPNFYIQTQIKKTGGGFGNVFINVYGIYYVFRIKNVLNLV